MNTIWLLPHYVMFGSREISQTLIASVVGTILFVILTACYLISKKVRPDNSFVHIIDMFIEFVMSYLWGVWWSHVWPWAIIFTTTVFFYVFWINIVWLFGDMVILAVPAWHDYFRPAGSDIMFNLVLALMWVLWSIWYGFYSKWYKHIQHYIPYKGIGIVPQVHSIGTFFGRIGDIMIGLVIWFIELMWEAGRVASLSLRLFGNIFVGIILLWLVTQVANTIFFNTPFLIPLTMFAYELVVAWLQAFLFSLLITVYFRIASDVH